MYNLALWSSSGVNFNTYVQSLTIDGSNNIIVGYCAEPSGDDFVLAVYPDPGTATSLLNQNYIYYTERVAAPTTLHYISSTNEFIIGAKTDNNISLLNWATIIRMNAATLAYSFYYYFDYTTDYALTIISSYL